MFIALLFGVLQANGSTIVDQRWERPDPYIWGGSSHSIYLNSPVGQEFTPTVDNIIGVELPIGGSTQNMPPGEIPPIIVKIRDDVITGNIVATTTLTPSGGLWRYFDFGEAISITIGNRYVIDVSQPEFVGVNWMWKGWYDTNYIGIPGRRIINGVVGGGTSAFGFRTYAISELYEPPVADADGPYNIEVGDTLTLDASGSTDADDDIVSYMWDLDDDENFETDAGGQAIFDVNYTSLQSLGLLINYTYNIHLKVIDSKDQRDVNDSTLIIVPEPATYYVDADANGANDGTSWADAYNYLQDALGYGNEIWVAEGIYKPDQGFGITPGDRYKTFQMINGVAIYGGFPYSGGTWEDRDPNQYETILSGDLNGDDVEVIDPAGLWAEPTRAENSYHVVTGSYTDETAILDGFTITSGNAAQFQARPSHCEGGGMYVNRGSPTVTNCTFSSNSTHSHGGEGGGMYNYNKSDPVVTNCTFSGNSATWGGGMFNDWNSSPTVTNCTFSGNTANSQGGAMYDYANSDPVLINCTFSGNSGGMYNSSSNSPILSNCILWSNSDSGGVDESAQIYGGTPVVNYCCIEGWTGALGGTGNHGDDPLFVDPGYWADESDPNIIIEPNDPNAIWIDGDYHLLPTSLCIDAGDNTAVPADTTDLDGDGDTTEPIPWDLDGGCRFVDDPDAPDTGNGTPPIVDMGAYEVVPPPLEVPMKFTPQALNPNSKGKWVKAHLVLPDGFAVEDVDVNTPAKLCPLGIESDYINAFINEDGLVEIEIGFGRAAFCGRTDYGPADVIVVGLLTTGQYFYGTDTIRIITHNLHYLAVFASYWLDEDCGAPDWCNGFDLDQDSVVNFIDFALFDSCCVEIITQ